MNHC